MNRPTHTLHPRSIALIMFSALATCAVAATAPGGESGATIRPATPDTIAQARQTYWSLQPVRLPQPPAVADESLVASPIDRFVVAKLAAAGLAPSPPAERRTLIRRAYFDLIGLPPTFQQVEAFVADPAPLVEAFAKVVDELLASPRYGERWGRHWLDVARYADTKGYVFTQEPRYPFAYTYRDYVIAAFNDDKPYDRFIIEQIAADKLDLGDDKRPLAAMGFLTVGRRFSNNVNDIIDDRIDVVTRGLMGLTVTCARCHDHKYDPIPTADYYSLYGVFASSREPDDLPQIGEPAASAEYDKFKAELHKRQQAVDDYRAGLPGAITHELRSRAGDYLAYVAKTLPNHAAGRALLQGPRGELRRGPARQWEQYLTQTVKADDPVFGLWRMLADLKRDTFAEQAAQIIARVGAADSESALRHVNPRVADAFSKTPPASMLDAAKVYGDLLEGAYQQWQVAQKAKADQPSPQALPDTADEQLRQVLYAPNSPAVVEANGLARGVVNRAERDHLRSLERKIDEWMVGSPAAPPHAMIMVDNDRPTEPRIFERGSQDRPGPIVPRQFLQVLAPIVGSARFTDGSGRLELAKAVANRANPLTARVFVNRVWQHHFGAGLVRTASDFGARSDPPTHPQLLDWLAATFMNADAWSVKKLHRRIMLSRTYMQASLDRDDARAADPENRLLWKMNRQRLDFEAMRDALLAVAGRVDTTMGGRPVNVTDPNQRRRTVYGFVDRQDLPGLFRAFDFANPDASSPGRPNTTVPQQALFMMNAPFVTDQARAIVARSEVSSQSDPAKRVQAIYRIVYSRAPAADEVATAVAFIHGEDTASESDKKLSPWEKYVQALLLANEFVFVD